VVAESALREQVAECVEHLDKHMHSMRQHGDLYMYCCSCMHGQVLSTMPCSLLAGPQNCDSGCMLLAVLLGWLHALAGSWFTYALPHLSVPGRCFAAYGGLSGGSALPLHGVLRMCNARRSHTYVSW
jgi:hypothetical protein